MTMSSPRTHRPWSSTELPVGRRVELLMAEMSLEEKLAQLGSLWPGLTVPQETRDEHAAREGDADGTETAADTGADRDRSGNVAPLQEVFARPVDFAAATEHGLGQLTRPFGSRPVEPADGVKELVAYQRDLMDRTRLGLPALVHEECLTGFTAYRASVFPASIAWAAAFDPELVETMAAAIGEGMHALGVHQGLSPVLDVVRDYRWGRVEETLGEDPYLVSAIGTAYVRGLESSGVISTLKHFAGYSASRAARNHGPVGMGPRELADVILPPFEAAIREGGARSVMNSYSEVDGVPVAADASLLTDVLREQWGFDGTVVSDYWAIAFLRLLHHVADSWGEAGAQSLSAGIDVELPGTLCYGEPLAELVRSGQVPEALVDRALERVLRQKAELGLLDADWSPEPAGAAGVDLDPPANRETARLLAERGIVLLDNPGALLPLAPGLRKVAVVGPCADDANAFFGCYSFPNHVLPRHPELGNGIEALSLLEALRAERPGTEWVHETGCPVKETDRSGIAAAVAAAEDAELCVVVVGDRAGLFGGGTSGEGCDVADLALPGVQDELVEALLATGTPVVLVSVSGRPYALGAHTGRTGAAVQAFFPGEEGGPALAGVLCGRVNPSGRLPVQIPSTPGGQPHTYLAPPLGHSAAGVSSLKSVPAYPFGHGTSYTAFAWSGAELSAREVPTDGEVEISLLVRNTGERAGTEVVQLYFNDPVAQLPRPVSQLAGFARVDLEPGQERRVTFRLHSDRTAFTGRDLTRIVEPGEIHLLLGASSDDIRLRESFRLTGPVRTAGSDRVLFTPVTVSPATADLPA
ncbi:beta-glucosidase [Streptomyces sp. NPDC002932]|uniref:beta-xylosidase/alpha-l-arabinosidase n=1 Tax=Streptomyces sp. NPDC002932 TaxID=3364672 RepID=UPI0036C1A4B9